MNPAASPVAPSFFEWCLDLPAPFIGANIQRRKIISIDICNAELFIYLRWASQHWLQLSVRAKFISVNCLEPWVVETSLRWRGGNQHVLTSQQSVRSVTYPKTGMGQICLDYWVSCPAFTWLWYMRPKFHRSSLSSQWTELLSCLPKTIL